jgi:hypothetical protein
MGCYAPSSGLVINYWEALHQEVSVRNIHTVVPLISCLTKIFHLFLIFSTDHRGQVGRIHASYSRISCLKLGRRPVTLTKEGILLFSLVSPGNPNASKESAVIW